MRRYTRALVELTALMTLMALGAVPSEARSAPPELCWIPREATFVLGFEATPGSSDPLAARFREELLFASGHRAAFERLGTLTGLSDPERLVVATLRWADGGESTVGFVHGRIDVSHLATYRVDEHEVYLVSGERDRDAELAFARLDHETWVYGNVLAVLTAVELVRAPCAPDPELMGMVDELDASASVWGFARGEWLDFDVDEETLASADVRGRSLSRSLTRVRGMLLSAEVSTGEARLSLRTRGADAEDARILADALNTFVTSARRGVAEAIRPSLERVTVLPEGSDVRFAISLDGRALEQLRLSQTGRNLLTWRLGEEQRERTQRIARVIDALDIEDGSRVADIGAGAGFFSVRLARVVGPEGRVFGVDIEESVVDDLRQRAERAELENVESIHGDPDDPRLPAESLDGALIVNAYHEMREFESMLAHIRRSLKPGGRLVLVEPYDTERQGEPREEQVQRHEIAPTLLERELRGAGFEIVDRVDAFITRESSSRGDSLLVATRP